MDLHVCPWWLGYFLASPIRKLWQSPESILGPFIQKGYTVLDVGSAMGFFSLPMARLVGENGRVVCVDVQQKMIDGLKKRATKAGLVGRMEFRVCESATLAIADLNGTIDFALAFAVVHEAPDAERLFAEIHKALKISGRLLLSEPTGHVSEQAFAKTLSTAQSVGFQIVSAAAIARSHSRLLTAGKTSD